ncbi:MAG: T9SS type A sorting domain-containing protein [Paludibacteraceae bacterium]|nr:T9SS type A sorting domain-containing protein [Paludibacteraceae bacterium]
MNRFLKYCCLLALSSLGVATNGQIQMGGWRTHYSYNSVGQLVSGKDIVYGVADGALFSVDDFGEVRTYSKLTGLSDNDIRRIAIIEGNSKVIIAYSNANIDILDENGYVVNIGDLSHKSMNGSKEVNAISCHGGKAYLACGFGVTTINLSKMEFSDTYILGRDGGSCNVVGVGINNDTIYALTDTCLLRGSIGKTNLMNYQNWEEVDMPTGKNRSMAILENVMYILKEDSTLWQKNGGTWTVSGRRVTAVWTEGGCLFTKHSDGRLSVNGKRTIQALTDNPNAATYDGKNVWFSAYRSIVMQQPNGEETHFHIDGPATNFAWRIKSRNGRVMTIPGGRFALNYYRNGDISWLENDRWEHIPSDRLSPSFPCGMAFDFVDIESDPEDVTHFWVASYGAGLAEFRNNSLANIFSCDNSLIETLIPGENRFYYMRVDGLTYDKDGRLWMTNNGDAQIKCIDRNGVWHKLAHSGLTGVETLQDILIDKAIPTRKYVLCPRFTDSNTSMLFIFDDNGTIDDTSDDQTRALTFITDQDGKRILFSENRLRSIIQDQDGIIWVGTTSGLFTISRKAKVFDAGFKCSRIKISRNDGSNLADYLLGTETINAIAIDGGNRKWFGTNNGVFLVSADGQETIEHFTTENSPLLSNTVTSIGIDGNTGEVFFGTDNGIISYKSDATEGKEDFDEIHAYPNPVRPDFDGVITITGLMEGSHVKICDVNGATVYETVSNGGTATWDRGDTASGVYFAMCFVDGKKKGTCKILVIRRE